VSSAPVTILVPKDVEGASSALKGIELQPAERTLNERERTFSSVDFDSQKPGELTVRNCRGERYSTGDKAQSCVSFDAHVDSREEPEQWRLTLTPTLRRDEPGHDALFLPIDLPKASLADWYYSVSHHGVEARYKIESTFPPEALKANFDRLLHRVKPGEADGAIRQYHDVYALDLDQALNVRVGLSFFPYHTGSLAEVYLLGESAGAESSTAIDWTTRLRAAKERLEAIARD
jgi:hypothetical protein